MNPPLLDEPPQTVIPRPPRFLRILLVVFEVCAWATAALLTSMSAVAALIYSAGDVPVAARLIDGASLIENGGGTVESGMVDVVLEDVPFAVSWPYLLVIVAGVFLWAVLCVSLARKSPRPARGCTVPLRDPRLPLRADGGVDGRRGRGGGAGDGLAHVVPASRAGCAGQGVEFTTVIITTSINMRVGNRPVPLAEPRCHDRCEPHSAR